MVRNNYWTHSFGGAETSNSISIRTQIYLMTSRRENCTKTIATFLLVFTFGVLRPLVAQQPDKFIRLLEFQVSGLTGEDRRWDAC